MQRFYFLLISSHAKRCSVLSRNGDKAEALEVLHRAARLEPKIQKYVDVLEEELRTQADSASKAKGRR
jgi:hypothetical protein